MTQEEKNLLLKDLCARLPYKVMVHIRYNSKEPCYGELTPKDIQWFIDFKIKEIKPYLRPMSSMTEEESNEFQQLDTECDKMPTFEYVSIEHYRIFDWLNAHHFDYRGLIEKGLALEAPKGMYNLKEK